MNQIRSIALVGAGKMTRGIAPVCAHAGYSVSMVDLKKREDYLQQAIDEVKSNLNFLVEHEFITEPEAESALSRVKGTIDLNEAIRGADFVIESLPEVLELKQQVFRQMDELCQEHTILSTDTSSFRTSDIAAVTTRPHNVIGFHWINPPYLTPVVEIVRGQKTSDSTVSTTRDLALKLGKIPVVCRESPGFLINRLQFSLLGEAISLLEEGVASVEDIDNAMRLSIGLRLPLWGPLKTNDLIGNKRTTLAVFEYLYKETGNDRFRPPNLLRQKVEREELGLVTGKGWYDYSGESPGATRRRRDEQLVRIIKFLKEEGLLNT